MCVRQSPLFAAAGSRATLPIAAETVHCDGDCNVLTFVSLPTVTDKMQAPRSVHRLFSATIIASLFTACGGQVEVVGASANTGGASSSIVKKPVAKAITAAYDHSCTVLDDGTVRCWGSNGIGQLGNGTYSDWSLPVTVVGITNPIGVAVGESYTCAVLSDGLIECWGGSLYGQLGNVMDHSYVPVAIPGITNAISIAAASDHTCAVLSDGSVQCW